MCDVGRSWRQKPTQKHARLCPVTFDRPNGSAERFSDLFVREAAEESTLDDARQTRSNFGESIERIIDLQQHLRLIVRYDQLLVERDCLLRAAALDRDARLRAIGEDMAHHYRGERQEMRPIIPTRVRLIDEREVHL